MSHTFTARDGRKIELRGLKTCGCWECGEVFSAVSNFDKHRSKGKCLNPATLGLVKSHKGIWKLPDTSGRWDDDDT
jgi:hypothetical protein